MMRRHTYGERCWMTLYSLSECVCVCLLSCVQVVIVGDHSVGKTSLIKRFCEDKVCQVIHCLYTYVDSLDHLYFFSLV